VLYRRGDTAVRFEPGSITTERVANRTMEVDLRQMPRIATTLIALAVLIAPHSLLAQCVSIKGIWTAQIQQGKIIFDLTQEKGYCHVAGAMVWPSDQAPVQGDTSGILVALNVSSSEIRWYFRGRIDEKGDLVLVKFKDGHWLPYATFQRQAHQ
jgi:hypothetical protein